MVKFFIDIDNGEEKIHDEFGANYLNQETAESEAFAVLPEIAKDNQLRSEWHKICSYVRNEEGHVIFIATLTLTARRAD